MPDSLMDNGVITGTASRCAGVMVYRLMGPFPGIFGCAMVRSGAITLVSSGPRKVFVPPARALLRAASPRSKKSSPSPY